MSDQVRNVTREYEVASLKALKFDPGQQPDIASLLRQAYEHGYAQALIDTNALRADSVTPP